MRASGSSTVTASPYVAVHLHSATVTHHGGVLIDLTTIDRADWSVWAQYHGVEVVAHKKSTNDELIVYKAVDADLKSGRGFEYPIGKKVTDPHWQAGDFCGNGLHFSPTPTAALAYFETATRFLKVAVKVSEVSIIDGNYSGPAKLKARAAKVLAEVDLDGREL